MASFEQPGVVSLWLFLLPENPGDASKDVLRDFCGVPHYDLDCQEGVNKETTADVRSLIEPLSYSSSFVAKATDAAKRIGVVEAFGVLAQYDFAYSPDRIVTPVADDPKFIGCFNWSE